MDNSYSIYKHIFPNNKVYVGMTFQKVENRWRYGAGYNNQPVMKRAIKKFGWENIKHEVLFENLTKEEAEDIERKTIKELKANNKKYGYNLDNGGKHAGRMSQESIEKMRNSLKNSPYNWRGKHHTEEAKQKLREKRLGELNGMYGKHYTEEEKIKRSIIIKEAKAKLTTNVAMCDMNNNVLQVFSGVNEAARQTKIPPMVISRCCRGKQEHKCRRGYKFYLYVNNEIVIN